MRQATTLHNLAKNSMCVKKDAKRVTDGLMGYMEAAAKAGKFEFRLLHAQELVACFGSNTESKQLVTDEIIRQLEGAGYSILPQPNEYKPRVFEELTVSWKKAGEAYNA